MTTLALPNQRLGLAGGNTDRGVSEAAKELATRWLRLSLNLREPLSQGEGVRDALGELDDILMDCSQPDWDGYGAEPVDLSSVVEARRFLLSLPVKTSAPEVSVDPDGEVSMDWKGARGAILSVSIRADGRLSYAGRFGIRRASGTEYFTDEVPRKVVEHLRRTLP